MTDCDLCGKGIPTVIPVRVKPPLLKFAYPEGVWKGLCETCLDSAQKTYLSIDKNEVSCRNNKCALCGHKGKVYPAELQVPDFTNGTVRKEVNLCTKCLESIDKAYVKYKREQIEAHAHGHH